MKSALVGLFLTIAGASACSQNGPGSAAGQQGAAGNAIAGGTAPASAPVSSSSSASSATSPASSVTKPQLREVTIPSGTPLSVKLTNAVASDSSKAEDPVRGTLAKPVVVDGATVVPSGSSITGSVLEAKESGRVKGLASIAIRFDRLKVGSETHEIRTARIAREAKPTKGEDAKKVGIGAGAGALVGALAGGKKGALIGGGIGAGAGTGVVMATRGEEVRLNAGMTVTTSLKEPLTIQVAVQ